MDGKISTFQSIREYFDQLSKPVLPPKLDPKARAIPKPSGSGSAAKPPADTKPPADVKPPVDKKVTAKVPEVDTPAPAPEKLPGQSVPLPVEALPQGEPWFNDCAGCRSPEIAAVHEDAKCCIKCRCYRAIDVAALSTSLTWLKKIKPGGGATTFEDMLIKGAQEREDAVKFIKTLQDGRPALQKKLGDFGPTRQAVLANWRTLNEKAIEARRQNVGVAAAETNLQAASIERNNLETAFRAAQAENSALNDQIYAAQDVPRKIDQDRIGLTQSIARFLLEQNGLTKADNVARARFFFTWIAVSIKYDKTVSEPLLGPPLERTDAGTLLRGSEVCQGFALLFRTMFNATQDPEAPQAVYLTGIDKQEAGPITESAIGHAWNAFPTKNDRARPGWQLTDVTWGSGAENNVGQLNFKPEWFAPTPEYFIHTHFPTSQEGALKGDEAQLLSNPLAKAQFLGQFHKRYSKVTGLAGCNLALGTVAPDDPNPLGWSKDVVITFSRICGHSKMGVDGLYITTPIVKDGEDGKKKDFIDLDTCVAFTSKGPNAPWTVTMPVRQIEDKPKLSLIVLSAGDKAIKLNEYKALAEGQKNQMEILNDWEL